MAKFLYSNFWIGLDTVLVCTLVGRATLIKLYFFLSLINCDTVGCVANNWTCDRNVLIITRSDSR